MWSEDDMQSFPPIRFDVPRAMGYAGRANVIDPDVLLLTSVRGCRAKTGSGCSCRRRAEPLDQHGSPPRLCRGGLVSKLFGGTWRRGQVCEWNPNKALTNASAASYLSC